MDKKCRLCTRHSDLQHSIGHEKFGSGELMRDFAHVAVVELRAFSDVHRLLDDVTADAGSGMREDRGAFQRATDLALGGEGARRRCCAKKQFMAVERAGAQPAAGSRDEEGLGTGCRDAYLNCRSARKSHPGTRCAKYK